MVRRTWSKRIALGRHRHIASSQACRDRAVHNRGPCLALALRRCAHRSMNLPAWPATEGFVSGASAITRTALASLSRLGSDVASVAAPVACAGCHFPGLSLCAECHSHLVGVPRRHRPSPAPATWLDLHVVTTYAGTTRSIITAWKERGRRDLAPYLASALSSSIAAALAARGLQAEAAAIVPVPATRAARRRRGEDAWGRVVRMAVRQLTAAGAQVCVDPILVHTRQPRDQSGLDARERHLNLDGAMACSRLPSGSVIVVDDIVTTGSTLAAAARALATAGVTDACAAAIAATSRDSGSRRPPD